MVQAWLSKLASSFGSSHGIAALFDGEKVSQIPVVAIDLELTSLDPKHAKVTSIGWVGGHGGSIELSSSYYKVIRASGDLSQSPVIHGLTAEDLALGSHIKEALSDLVKLAEQHVWVFHNTALDMAVLQRVCCANGMSLPTIVTLDTLKLALYQLEKSQQVVTRDAATLAKCRERLGLPIAPAHNALDDAMATLQLWFAQSHQMDSTGQLSLSDLKHTGALKVFQPL